MKEQKTQWVVMYIFEGAMSLNKVIGPFDTMQDASKWIDILYNFSGAFNSFNRVESRQDGSTILNYWNRDNKLVEQYRVVEMQTPHVVINAEQSQSLATV